MKNSTPRTTDIWVGFVNGKPDFYESEAEYGKTVLAAFKTRREARAAYKDARKCWFVWDEAVKL